MPLGSQGSSAHPHPGAPETCVQFFRGSCPRVRQPEPEAGQTPRGQRRGRTPGLPDCPQLSMVPGRAPCAAQAVHHGYFLPQPCLLPPTHTARWPPNSCLGVTLWPNQDTHSLDPELTKTLPCTSSPLFFLEYFKQIPDIMTWH